MTTTTAFLDALKAKNGGLSDYAIAPLLGVSRAQISRYRNKHDILSNDMALKVANLLEIDTAYVLACVQQERAKTEVEKAVWSRIIRLFPKPVNDALCIMLSRWDGTERRNSARLSLC